MRIEATIPDGRGAALKDLAEQLGLSKSQLIDEALALFLMAVMEIRRGRRFMSVGPAHEPCSEVMTPTLVQLQWMLTQSPHALGDDAIARIAELVESPPAPNEALRAALADRP